MKKYLLIGGNVVSRTDGQTHYVSANRLCVLYGLDPYACIMLDDTDVPAHGGRPAKLLGVDESRLIILRPRADGDYSLPLPDSSS